MCGIFAYKGQKTDAYKILLHGLERLEYRGYDSAGICIGNDQGSIKLIKSIGKVSKLVEKVNQELKDSDADRTFGIAHTRWATHGGITEHNAHPHYSMNQNFYVVHNGIIENYHKLKQELIGKGYTFYGDTDTEVIANLLQEHDNGNFYETVKKVLSIIRGAYAIVVVSIKHPGQMIAAKIGSPLIFGYNQKGDLLISSDKQALSGYVEKLMFLEDGDMVIIQDNDYTIKSDDIKITRDIEDMDIDTLEASKGDYPHFMLKEIYEQANIIRRIFKGRIDFKDFTMNTEAFHGMQNENFDRIIFVACGTSYNAGLLGAYWIQNLTGIQTECEIASEYEYKNISFNDQTLFVFVSQSGETADSIEVLKLLKNRGAKTFGIVNVVGSTISRLTDHGLFTRAGVEIGVASTKAFTAQITCILLLALFLGQKRGLIKSKYEKILSELSKVPTMIEEILEQSNYIKEISKSLSKYKDFFFLGRHYQLAVARESSLKFKEISYLHSEFYPAGELKHGPLAMIDENVPSIMFAPNDSMFEKNISSVQEIKARKGIVITVGDQEIPNSDWHIHINHTIDEIYPFVSTIIGQLLAYHVADILGKDIDKPRNLAKSVTVK